MSSVTIKVTRKTKGGPGSGHWGHSGLPGTVGGSAPSGGASSTMASPDMYGPYQIISGKVKFDGNNATGVDDSATAWIANEFAHNWGGTPVDPRTVIDVIREVRTSKLRGWKLHDSIVDKFKTSTGATLGIIKLTKDTLKAEYTKPRSAEEARADRLLRTRDSTGKARARKMA